MPHTADFEKLKAHIVDYPPEKMAPECGIEADMIREVARLYARSEASIIFWGMGISQHIHGTDNARCLIALSLITGQIGRPGTGLHPLRGQNNVQGASDAGPDRRTGAERSAGFCRLFGGFAGRAQRTLGGVDARALTPQPCAARISSRV